MLYPPTCPFLPGGRLLAFQTRMRLRSWCPRRRHLCCLLCRWAPDSLPLLLLPRASEAWRQCVKTEETIQKQNIAKQIQARSRAARVLTPRAPPARAMVTPRLPSSGSGPLSARGRLEGSRAAYPGSASRARPVVTFESS